jgi:hypothetical protein
MERVLDKQGRWRNKTVAFRMSPEEDELLEARVRLSGMTKQDYIIHRLQEKEIVVVGNPRVYKALRNQMEQIYVELQRIEAGQLMDDDLLEVIELVAVTLNGMKEEMQ